MASGDRIDHLHDMVVTQVHAATELAFIGDNTHLRRAILFANLDPPKGLAQRST